MAEPLTNVLHMHRPGQETGAHSILPCESVPAAAYIPDNRPLPCECSIIHICNIARCFNLSKWEFTRRGHSRDLKDLGVIFPMMVKDDKSKYRVKKVWCAFPSELRNWAMWRARENRPI
jgi:hypothetical protein